MPLWEHYHQPQTVSEALSTLAGYAGRARIVAGGTDLLLELQQGRHPAVAALVDVTRIAELTRLTQEGEYLHIGAAVPHTQIVADARVAAGATCLVESCGVIGGPQVRNVATLGGNVAHALPAGDGTLSLVALDAEAQVARVASAADPTPVREWRPVRTLYAGPGRSAVDQTREVIVQFRFRAAGRGEASAFKRIMRPQGVALPILGLAAWVAVREGTITAARLALGPAGATPLRPSRAEAFLIGQSASADLATTAAALVLEDAHLRTSAHRATADYRRALIAPLVARALNLAIHRAVTGHVVPEGIGEG